MDTKNENRSICSRRDALKLSAAGVLVAGLPCVSLAQPGGWKRGTIDMGRTKKLGTQQPKEIATQPKKIGISIQLYSIRGDCRKNFDKALAWVAEMGFDAVEFAGYHSYQGKPKALKKRLDSLGLKVAAAHLGMDKLTGKALQKTADFHKEIGCKYLICPGTGWFVHPEKSKKLAKLFNQTAKILKPQGMYCGYHNHTREFADIGDTGKTYWDLFAERTVKDVVLQQDVAWSFHAGKNPTVYVRKYPGRSKVLHFKASVSKADKAKGKLPIIGKDSIDWKSLITASREVGGTEWFTIEQEARVKGKSAMESTAMSLNGLKKILAKMS